MDNLVFDLASEFVRSTAAHIYLTGKAGTGKTTFLRTVVPESGKKYIIVAPTGVAAINAGGVTIHSMFGLPTKAFIPQNDVVDPNLANNPAMLSRHFRYNRNKVEVLRELELLVIDEVSMVRMDILDAIDLALRSVRRNSAPFGGVQVLFIGDLYQLAPVIKDDEGALLQQYYKGKYFFNAKVYSKINPVHIELETIYRQQDSRFVGILNNIRHAAFDQDDHEALMKHYRPDFQPDEPGWITLTTHNAKADQMNEQELQRLPGEPVVMPAKISKDFPDNMFPTERELRFKPGAQVMFIKNDTSGDRMYYNGRIGTIAAIAEDSLEVTFQDTGQSITVKPETWENTRYTLNKETDKLEEEVMGSFTQYPLRLAWAITIHKSQGLSFDRAVIDAGASFAPGQVYVALSRCRSMDGLVLKSEITPRSIQSDHRVVEFSESRPPRSKVQDRLWEEQQKYARIRLFSVFSFDRLERLYEEWLNDCKEHSSGIWAEMTEPAEDYALKFRELEEVARRFRNELELIFPDNLDDQTQVDRLSDRVVKGADYFAGQIFQAVLAPLTEINGKLAIRARAKKHHEYTTGLLDKTWSALNNLFSMQLNGEPLYRGERRIHRVAAGKEAETTEKKPGKKTGKGDSTLVTLQLFRDGHSIAEMAEMRGLTEGTIEAHLGMLIGTGKIALEELINSEQQEIIEHAIDTAPEPGLGAVRQKLGDDYSFGMIRWVLKAREHAAAG